MSAQESRQSRAPADPERALVARLHQGDAAAFESLLDLHREILQRFATRWLPAGIQRRVSAADLLQDVRLVALKKATEFEYRGPGSFRNWLLGILRHEVLAQVRRHQGAGRRDARREVTRGARPETGHLPGREPSPSQAAVASELASIARRAMEELPPDYRRVLSLAREEGLPLREAAERLERSYEATKKLYARAMARFTRAFEARRGEGSDERVR